MTRTALESTYDKARGRGETASLSVKTRGGRETLIFCSKDSSPKGSSGSCRSDKHNSVKKAERKNGRKGKQPGIVDEATEPGIEAMSHDVEHAIEGIGDYYCMRTATDNSGRGGPQSGGSEGSTEYNNVVVCSKDLVVKGSCGSYEPDRANKGRKREIQGKARRGGARGQEFVFV